jgi:hypothetical protein
MHNCLLAASNARMVARAYVLERVAARRNAQSAYQRRCRQKEKPRQVGAFLYINYWRREPESNRPKRLCRPLHNRFAIAPQADWNLAADSQICLVSHHKDRPIKQKGKHCFPL